MNEHLLPRLLIAIAVILGVSRLMGMLFVRLRQPQVVGEMVAGIMLGPSLLGWLSETAIRAGWWDVHLGHSLFPTSIIPYLGVLSQLGVILFLFLVGLELDPKLLRNKGQAAVAISHASIVVPFLLGATLTLFLYPRLFNQTDAMRFTPVALFMGAAMSITAFPVLARILTERHMHKTRVGAVAITCAAVDDVTAWCMLAFVVGVARTEGLMPALQTAALSAVYVLAMFYILRPFLARLQAVHDRQGKLSSGAVALVLGLVMLSAWTTEKIGIHALFGAFMVGAMMPKGTQFVRTLTEKLEDVIVVLLLPLFFAYTGLKTQIGLLSSLELWGYTALVITVACLGKFGGSAVAGRLCGFGWREAGAVGILMNTRGLMELVILNIGRELGVITPAVFAMMVLMALATTAMTSPILHWLYPRRLYEDEVRAASPSPKKASSVPSVLIPVADPRSGGPLLQLADWITAAVATPIDESPAAAERRERLGLPNIGERKIYALHLRRPPEKDIYSTSMDEASSAAVGRAPRPQTEVSLQPLLEFADRHAIPVESIAFVSRDVSQDITRTAVERNADLVLMGSHRALVDRTVLGGTVHRVLTETQTDVAILLDRGFRHISRVMVPYLAGPHDRLALELASRLAKSAQCSVTVLHVVPPEDGNDPRPRRAARASEVMSRVFGDPLTSTPVEFRVIQDADPIAAVVAESGQFDLMIVGIGEEWGLEPQRFGLRPERLASEARCSMLLVRKADAITTASSSTPGALPANSGTNT